MFADVSGSSALYQQMSNGDAKAIIDHAIEVMSSETEAHHGRVIKTIGDEVMASFDCADDACQTALAIQYRCSRSPELTSLSIRIGMDFGPTLLSNNDLFGDTVNDAAYISHIARGNQILISAAMHQSLQQVFKDLSQEFDNVRLKGHNERSRIYRLEWEPPTLSQNPTTVMSIADITQTLDKNALYLTCSNKQVAIYPEQTPYIIGRDQNNSHLHISSDLASRDHCHILYRRGKYVLVEHSTNGTFVTQPHQAEIYLRREELPLAGQGSFSIGQSGQKPNAFIINYSTKN